MAAETTSTFNNRSQGQGDAAAAELSRSKFGQQVDMVRLDRKAGEPGNEKAVFFRKENGSIELSRDDAELSTSGNLRVTSAIEGPSHAMSVRFSDDGCSIASGFADGSIQIHDVKSGRCTSNLFSKNCSANTSPESVTCLRFCNSDQLLLATYASGFLRYWHPRSSKCFYALPERRQILAAAFNPSKKKFVTTGSTPEIYLYDLETRQRLATLEGRDHRAIMDGHRARVFAVQYHPTQQNIFLTGGWDDTVQYWDDRLPRAVRKFYGPHICGDALDIDSERGQVLTGSWRVDNTLQIWDFNTGCKIRDIPDDKLLGTSSLYCAQWLGSDQILSGGSDRNFVRTVNHTSLTTTGHVSDLPSGVYSVDSSCQDKRSYDDRSLPTRVAVASSDRVYLLTRNI